MPITRRKPGETNPEPVLNKYEGAATIEEDLAVDVVVEPPAIVIDKPKKDK